MRYLVAVLGIAVGGLGALQTTPLLAQQRSPIDIVKGGILDEVALYTAKLPSASRVVMRPFSATDEDIVTGDKKDGDKKDATKTMQADGARMLGDRFVAKLKELGPFSDVTVLGSDAAVPAGALVVDGKFTELDPGSRAKRYFVGFGAGKSGVTVNGSVKGSDGMLMATFVQRRVGVMGAGGGDSLGKLAGDAKSIGEDLAKFLSAWAREKKLK